MIGDRRQLLVAERAEKQKELFARLQVGDRVDGVIKNVTDFGAFVDLGGVDGLPISDFSIFLKCHGEELIIRRKTST